MSFTKTRTKWLTMVLVVLYSLLIIATTLPSFGRVAYSLILLYYLLVPGYVITIYLRESYSLLERVAFSIVVGLALYLTIYSAREISTSSATISFSIVIPSVSIFLILLDYYRFKSQILNSDIPK